MDPTLESLRAMQSRLREPLAAEAVRAVVDKSLAICRELYGRARSSEALPLAQALLDQCNRAGDRVQSRRAATLCGVLSADTADIVGAIEHHVQVLRLATADEDRIEMSRAWNNMGLAIGFSGNYEMAARCYRRSLELLEQVPGTVQTRYAACCNLADALFQTGNVAEGVQFGERALRELTPELRNQDLYGAILLRRNLVRLLIAAGRTSEAEAHVAEAVALAGNSPSPRARIAADIARATHEMATGRADVALTRLDQALNRAREVPAAWRDTLVCVIRAEESAGNAARALMRLEELSNHIYNVAIDRARRHIELAGFGAASVPADDHEREQARARLISQLEPPSLPAGWKTLQRLAVGAVMRMDATGWHGMRVGALTKALALAHGMPPIQALEMGLAAELHDIGMMSVPEGILGKRGPLNAAEHAIVRKHSEAGAEMLRDDRHPRVLLAREIAKYHHARWDGTGYPERVGGEFIPIGARMCAIADAYDMMVCGLGGRAAKTMSEALQELHRGAGSQFDPELVECFDGMIRNESEERGMDLQSSAGMEDFQALVQSLQQDRGFV